MALLAAGCSSGPRHTGATGQLQIYHFAFHPTPLSARVGATLTVVNQDDTVHTLTADDHSFDTGSLSRDKAATVTFRRVGTFTYHCSIHNYMQGVVHVTA